MKTRTTCNCSQNLLCYCPCTGYDSGQSQPAQVMCLASGQGAVTWVRLNASTGQPSMELTVDGAKYGGGGNRLDISNVVASDEGAYRCSYQTGGSHTTCVFVRGQSSSVCMYVYA